MITIGIVDDEQAAAEDLKEYCMRFARENNQSVSLSVYHDGMDIVKLPLYPDILFLDISMPLLNGLKAAEEIRKTDQSCVIIFVTSMAQYAIHGYTVNALDFVVKPVAYKNFAFKMRKAVEVAKRRRNNTLTLTVNYGRRKVEISDITYVEVIKHKLIYHVNDEEIEVWDSISNAAATLVPHGFSFCKVCYLVNLRRVERVQGDSVYVGNSELKISRQKKKSFLDALSAYIL